MLGSIGRFLKNRDGAFAMQFALMVVPLTLCTGLAIDGGRAFLARYELASSLDAAALAVGSTYSEDADINAMAHNFVNRNFSADHEGEIVLELDADEERVLLKGNVTIKTYFMGLVGQDTIEVSAESEVKRGGNNVEVALALDITESMSGSRITALKQAASDLVDQVVNDVQTPYFSKVAIAPWANNVHVGATYADQIRGTLEGPTNITAATWRDGTAKSISGAAWRDGTAKTITGATWRNGTARTITQITKLTAPAPARIRVTTSASHGYANGQYVRITGANGSYTGLNNTVYVVGDVAATTYTLRDLANTSYITPPAGSTNSTAGSSQRCFNSTCEIQVTAASHGFATDDRVYLTGVSGMTQINNSASATWPVGATATNTFILTGSNGPASSNWTSGGTASECFTSTCEVRATTSASHGFANGDLIHIRSVGGMTQINNTNGNTWTIGSVASTTFILPGSVGTSYGTYSSATGTASECFAAGCEVVVTSADHGLANGDHIQISSVSGMTGIITYDAPVSPQVQAWTVEAVSGDNFRLDGSIGPNYGNYTSGGNVQCLVEGCQKFRFTTAAGGTAVRTASNCVTERTGAQAYTDAAPGSAPVGRHYPGAHNLVSCEANNMIVPLTADKTLLKAKINAMDVTGSTAGQMGAAWGWYMISPNWKDLWPDAVNKPLDYDTKELAKVVVLMTDGEFNTAHCKGVQSQTYGYSSIPNSDRINCNPAETPFQQAAHFCTNMKAAGVIVYTVGFELDAGSTGKDFLKDCATDESHAYLAASSAELKSAFKSIATQISRLRISK